jgi:hypothetical protein
MSDGRAEVDVVAGAARGSVERVDPDEVRKFAYRVWSFKQGEMVSLLIHLGDRLGLYKVLDGIGTVTAEELAERTGLHARWLREWLRGNAAADLLTSRDGEAFELTAVGAMVLAREGDSLQFAAGAFGPPPDPGLVDELAEAFRTGIGVPYDRHGAAGVHVTESHARSLGSRQSRPCDRAGTGGGARPARSRHSRSRRRVRRRGGAERPG